MRFAPFLLWIFVFVADASLSGASATLQLCRSRSSAADATVKSLFALRCHIWINILTSLSDYLISKAPQFKLGLKLTCKGPH